MRVSNNSMEKNEQPITDELIIRYLQGNLEDVALHEQIESWLAIDENRKAAQATYKSWELSMLTAPPRKDPQQAFDELMAKIKTGSKKKSISIWWYAAAASVLLAVGMIFFRDFTQPPQDIMISAMDGVKEHTLEDGSLVSLDDQSTLTYNPEALVSEDFRKVYLEGVAFFEVTHNAEVPFTVTTRDAVIQVLGTKFMVKTDGEAPTKVLVTEGKVKVTYQETQKELILTAEQETLTEEEGSSTPSIKPSDDNQLYWKTGVMTFENASLGQVLNTLSQEFDKQIITQNEQILSCTITATFKKQSLETILEVIKSIHQLESYEEGNKIVIVGDGCK